MRVELQPHKSHDLVSKKEVELPQYRVIVDGVRCGFIGWQKNAKLLLTVQVGPLERQQIEQQVAEILQRDRVDSALPAPIEEQEEPEQLPNDDFD